MKTHLAFAGGLPAFFSGNLGPSLVVVDFSIRWVCLMFSKLIFRYARLCIHCIICKQCLYDSCIWDWGYKLSQLLSDFGLILDSWPMDKAFCWSIGIVVNSICSCFCAMPMSDSVCMVLGIWVMGF